ncbi:NADH-quinone oxidoreductase subunit NuoH [Fontimonas sp. SYSU GA230001]|uniref:NADH-quinone oxidoreductase subunit NuoH n=1 Tax=Fontimonas sp. SYSU GA230001 TaxID=3142450 RepID=UPI0032B61B40
MIPQSLITVAILLVVVVTAALLIWVERRMLGLWQDRWGPNRVWFLGLGQVVADMIKIFTKHDWVPDFADRPVFVIAPAIVMVTILLAFAVVPIAPGISIAGDWNVGVLFVLGMTSLAVYSVMLGGWASNNKYALLGAIRASAQSISYEVFMGLALLGVVIQAGSFSLQDIVLAQQHGWFIVPQALGFVLFMIAGLAETHRLPLDLPEAEHELTAGFHTEYSGMKFGMFFVGEYVAVILVSALLTTFYFGGWLGPDWGLTIMGWAFMPLVWFVVKTGVFILFFVLLRAAIPRPRYDQLMRFGWLVLLPLALLNVAVTGAVVLWRAGA